MKLLAEISARFVDLPATRVDEEIDRALQTICNSVNIDESTIYQISDDPEVMVMTHIFRDPQLPPAPLGLNAAEHFPWCLKKILDNEEICFRDTQNAPPEANIDLTNWKLFNVRSVFIIPLSTGSGKPFGAWAFDSTSEVRDWPEQLQDKLRVLANVLASALERKNAHERLLEDDASLDLATQTVSVAFWTFNPATGVIWATPKSRELFGFDPNEDLTLEKYLRSVHPEDVSNVRSTLETTLRVGKGECEYRVRWPNKSAGWVLSRGGLCSRVSYGARLISGITLDITRQKRIEEVLRSREKELQRAQRLAQVGSWTWDLQTGSISWSDEMYRIHGRDPNLPPPSFSELEHSFTAESWAQLLADRDECLRTGRTDTLDLQLLRPDGTKRWVSAKAEAEESASSEGLRLRGTLQDITERKATEQKLREYEQTIENAAEMIAVIDNDYRYVIANRSFMAVRGMRKDEVVGRFMWDVLSEDIFTKTVKPRIDRAFKGEVVQYELKFSYPERGECDMAVSYFPLEGATGTERVLCILQDVTERHKKEQALLRSEERYRGLVESSHDWIWEVDVDGKYTYAGPQCVQILGYRPEEIVGKTPFDLMPAQEASRVAESFGAVARERKPFRGLENINRHKDGRSVVLETNGVPILDDCGNYLGYRGMDRDITDRKRADEALIESEQKFVTLFRTAPIAIALSSLDGIFVDVNDQFEVMTGYTHREAVGQSAQDLGLWIAPTDREQLFGKLMKEGRVRDIEYRFRTKSGEVRTGLLSSDVVDVGGTRYILTAVKDVTEHKKAEQNLRELSQRLINAQEVERKRIARELHDNISQRLALLSFGIERLAKSHSHALLGTELSKLLEETKLVSSDIQALSHQLHSSSLDILGLAAGIEGFCRELAKRHDLMIEFVHRAVPKDIPGELSLALFRITQEGLHNALKYSGVKQFEVFLIGTKEDLELNIRDHGVGFDLEEAAPRGLGLISMRERILPFNGTLRIVSKPMHGTEVSVRVPFNR